MATTGFWPVKGHLRDVLVYADNPDKTTDPAYVDEDLRQTLQYAAADRKTDRQMYVSALNCPKQQAYEWMTETKKRFGKMGGNVAYHGYQSFRTGEVTPQEAHEIGLETARRLWGDSYEVLVTTHLNTDNLHNHFVVNSVSFRTGRKYENHQRDHYRLREISDELCREHGLSVIERPSRRSESYAEWRLHQNGQCTRKDILRMDFEEALSKALDLDNLYDLMEQRGYTVYLHSKYPSFLPEGGKKPLRLKRNGKSLTEDDLEALLDESLTDPDSVIISHKVYKPNIPYGKQHGFKALYLSWMYVLGILGQGKQITYRVPYAELQKFEQYKRQQEYIDKYGIDTDIQLADRMKALKTEEADLTGKRAALRLEKRKGTAAKEDVSALTARLCAVRKELDICGKIAANAPRMKQLLREDDPFDRGEQNREQHYERS